MHAVGHYESVKLRLASEVHAHAGIFFTHMLFRISKSTFRKEFAAFGTHYTSFYREADLQLGLAIQTKSTTYMSSLLQINLSLYPSHQNQHVRCTCTYDVPPRRWIGSKPQEHRLNVLHHHLLLKKELVFATGKGQGSRQNPQGTQNSECLCLVAQ